MGTSYGPGIVHLVAEADLGTEADPGGDDAGGGPVVAWLLEIAALGLSRRFRDLVGDRVAEFTHDGGRVAWRWLSDEEAAPILDAGPSFGDTHEEWPAAMDHDLFVPNCTAAGPGSVAADGSPVDGWYYTPVEPVVERLRELLAEIDRGGYDGDPETVTELLERLEFCRRHDLFMVVA
ncbi:hypothetical protein Daura_44315 [Dactylosporangium aurantiacum]|uniref:Uncharacterized protein n=1 Tax=Dactylosporangium aurantiacum TaxID=35754 RepID=A0A9Q9IIV2_9ACTN|nr:hypothetical protein [Dactylosporangium aurantiacum]MDG6102192.1 hypothetical protein [Dactylosporangium aurantiacum]UWZ53490.1 hypothetical protein Daura_44315 [Dactylosporangium aurantiacum]